MPHKEERKEAITDAVKAGGGGGEGAKFLLNFYVPRLTCKVNAPLGMVEREPGKSKSSARESPKNDQYLALCVNQLMDVKKRENVWVDK